MQWALSAWPSALWRKKLFDPGGVSPAVGFRGMSQRNRGLFHQNPPVNRNSCEYLRWKKEQKVLATLLFLAVVVAETCCLVRRRRLRAIERKTRRDTLFR